MSLSNKPDSDRHEAIIAKDLFNCARNINESLIKRERMVSSFQKHITDNTFPSSYNSIKPPLVQHSKNTTDECKQAFLAAQTETIKRCKMELLRQELALHEQRFNEEKIKLDEYVVTNLLQQQVNATYPLLIRSDNTLLMKITKEFTTLWSIYLDKTNINTVNQARANLASANQMDRTMNDNTNNNNADILALQQELNAIKEMLKSQRAPDLRERGRAPSRGRQRENGRQRSNSRQQDRHKKYRSQSAPRMDRRRDGDARAAERGKSPTPQTRRYNNNPHTQTQYRGRGNGRGRGRNSTRSPSRDSRR